MTDELAQLSRDERRKVLARIQQRRREEPAATPLHPAIARHPDAGPQPLSFGQQRLWFLSQLVPESPAYNIFRVLHLAGPLDRKAFSRSLRAIVLRHEVLRTTFEVRNGTPMQVVGPPPSDGLTTIDLSALPPTARDAEARLLAVSEVRRPFDLAAASPLRVRLVALGPLEHLAVFTMHHVVCDDRSIGLFVRELTTFYASFVLGRAAALPELPIQYGDFSRWQREWLQGEILDGELRWWKERLRPPLPVLELPTDRPRNGAYSTRGGHRVLPLPPSLADPLRRIGRERGATTFMILLAALNALLARWSGQEDILVGTPSTYRNRVEMESLIGFFVNTLVLRGDLSGDPAFLDLLARTRESSLAAYEHHDLPFELLVDGVQPDRDFTRPPLFQVFLIVQSAAIQAALELPDLALRNIPVETGAARIDLGLELIDHPDGLVGEIEYSADLFDAATVARLAGHFVTLLQGIADAPTRRLSELPLLTKAELHQTRLEWADSGPATGGTVIQLFAAQARERPSAPALAFGGQEISYGELASRAARLARRLQAAGVGPEVPVGLLVERSPDAIAAILGILAAGGCYVPIDPDSPPKHYEPILREARVGAIVARSRHASAFGELNRPVVLVDSPEREDTPAAIDDPGLCEVLPEQPVYVIHTSGSLGRPKGVVVRHDALANFARAIVAEGRFGPGERTLLFASLTFDASALQIFPPLISGASLLLEANPGRLEPRQILELCEREGVTILDLPAAVWRQWIDEMADRGARILPRVGAFFTGGESLSLARLRSWAALPAHSARLMSSYGPTEATVTTTLFAIESGAVDTLEMDKIPLGRPLPGTRIELLDRSLHPVPAGVLGEIYIGGAGLARGYLGQPGLTAESFVPAPRGVSPGERLYRTGDLARWSPAGHLEFLGRADQQVKIRGFRVELGEIEASLARHPAVREAVVAAPEEASGSRRLVAYVIAEGGPAPTVGELRDFLAASLPDFMVPNAFVFLAELPLLPSGKVNRRALPAPSSELFAPSANYVAPRDPLESVLASIWGSVLQVERVGALDSFFELGGHSLMATQVLARLRESLEIELELRRLFEEPTLAGLAAAIRRSPDGERAERKASLLMQIAAMSEEEVEALLLGTGAKEEP